MFTIDERVDEEADDGGEPLFGGVLDAGHGVGVRGRAHAGFVREEAAGDAVAAWLP